jgi:hypothetical protein
MIEGVRPAPETSMLPRFSLVPTDRVVGTDSARLDLRDAGLIDLWRAAQWRRHLDHVHSASDPVRFAGSAPLTSRVLAKTHA